MTRFLLRTALRRGLLGGSRVWTVVGAVALGARVLHKLAGSDPEVVYREELRPGETLVLSHDREARITRAAP